MMTNKDKSGSWIDDEVESETEGDGSDSSFELDDRAIHAESNSGHSSSIAKHCSKFAEDDKDTAELGEEGESPTGTSTLLH